MKATRIKTVFEAGFSVAKRLGSLRLAKSYVLFLTIIGFLLLDESIKTVRALRSPPLGGVEVDLDSFSEASIAKSVLQRIARTTVEDYYSAWEAYFLANCRNGAKGPFDTAGWIGKLKAEIDLRKDGVIEELQRTLLDVYQDNNVEGDFLELYLDLLHENPDSPTVVAGARWAFVCAEHAQRTEELRDVFEHIIRFTPDRKLAHRMATVLSTHQTRVGAPE